MVDPYIRVISVGGQFQLRPPPEFSNGTFDFSLVCAGAKNDVCMTFCILKSFFVQTRAPNSCPKLVVSPFFPACIHPGYWEVFSGLSENLLRVFLSSTMGSDHFDNKNDCRIHQA